MFQYTHAANAIIFFFEGITVSNSAFLFFPSTSSTGVSLAFALSMRALASSISCIFLAAVAFDRHFLYP